MAMDKNAAYIALTGYDTNQAPEKLTIQNVHPVSLNLNDPVQFHRAYQVVLGMKDWYLDNRFPSDVGYFRAILNAADDAYQQEDKNAMLGTLDDLLYLIKNW